MLKKIIAISLLSLSALSTSSCDTLSQNSNNNSKLYAMYCDDANSEYYFYENLTYEISQKEKHTRIYKKDLMLFTLPYYSEYDLHRYAERVGDYHHISRDYFFDLITLGLTINKDTKEAVYWGHWSKGARYDV